MSQGRLFQDAPVGPVGFRYQNDEVTSEEEQKLIKEIQKIPLKTWIHKGYESKKKIRSYTKETGFPEFLKPLFKRTAHFAGILPSSIHHALITEYSPGTSIGWHRDGEAEVVIGISFGTAVSFRLRKLPEKFDAKSNKRKWEHITVTAEPRSAYIMSGESVKRWQHSISRVPDWRYSLTIRTVEK